MKNKLPEAVEAAGKAAKELAKALLPFAPFFAPEQPFFEYFCGACLDTGVIWYQGRWVPCGCTETGKKKKE